MYLLSFVMRIHRRPVDSLYVAPVMKKVFYVITSSCSFVWRPTQAQWPWCKSGLILSLHPANERRSYKGTPPLIGWAKPRKSSVNVPHCNEPLSIPCWAEVSCMTSWLDVNHTALDLLLINLIISVPERPWWDLSWSEWRTGFYSNKTKTALRSLKLTGFKRFG